MKTFNILKNIIKPSSLNINFKSQIVYIVKACNTCLPFKLKLKKKLLIT